MSRHVFTPAAHLLMWRDDKILLMRRFNTGYGDGQYGLPSGHVEKNEKLSETAAREAKEELGIFVKAKNLILVHTMRRVNEDDDYIDFFYETRTWTGAIYNAEPKKCDEIIWVKDSQLPENTLPFVKKLLWLYQRGRLFSEQGM